MQARVDNERPPCHENSSPKQHTHNQKRPEMWLPVGHKRIKEGRTIIQAAMIRELNRVYVVAMLLRRPLKESTALI
jgi:hypothetical protein